MLAFSLFVMGVGGAFLWIPAPVIAADAMPVESAFYRCGLDEFRYRSWRDVRQRVEWWGAVCKATALGPAFIKPSARLPWWY